MSPEPEAIKHAVLIRHESGRYMLHGGHRARCSCGWFSDCYAMLGDTQRAVEVHLRRSKQVDFDTLLARSSIGAAVEDVRRRGIDAHLVDLEREMHPARHRKPKRARAPRPADTAFLRGFGVALASIWQCHHDGQMVEHLLTQNGLTLDMFRDVDLLPGDYAAICQAIGSRLEKTK